MRRYMSLLQKSYVQGVKYPNLLDITISRQLEETAMKYPDRPSIISHHQGVTLSYSEVFEKAKNMAANLLEMGVQKGDRVGIYAGNGVEWFITQMACTLADVIFVTINPAYKTAELLYCLNQVELTTLITTNRVKPHRVLDNVDKLIDDHKVQNPLRLHLENLRNLRNIFVINDEGVSRAEKEYHNDFHKSFIKRQPGSKFAKNIQNNIVYQYNKAAVNIQFTSGTTGHPKGVTLSHHNILNNGYFLAKQMGYTQEDVICLPVPLYHCFGMVMGNLTALTKGAAVLFPSPSFNAEKTMEAAYTHNATAMYGVPTMFMDYLKIQEEKKYKFNRLTKAIMAGSLCPEILLRRVADELGITDTAVAYGMTETSPISFMTLGSDPIDKKTKTVGRIMKHVEAKVVDKEGNILDTNQRGELMVKGYSVMLGYYNDRHNTHKALIDGWMRTGDIVEIDSDGFAHVVGRIKDLIIRGGENIAPKEIEEYIHHIPQVENVQVIGVSDERYGEEICALVKLKANVNNFTKEDIYTYLKDRIAHFKVPKYVKFVDSFPITVTGKPQKFKMVASWNEEITKLGSAEIYRVR